MHFFKSVIMEVFCFDHIEIGLLSWGRSTINM
jgi:hypothetical protein